MKKRYKLYEPEQSVFFTFIPEKSFPPGSFERYLVDTINQLDLSSFNKAEDKGGETPYDPRALLGIIFYSYCKGCFSARKMERHCQYDLGYMFVGGHTTPEHTTISRFLNQFEEQIINLFSQLLYLADKSGFITYDLIAIDGTKIKTAASERFIGTIEEFKKKQEKLAEKIKEAIEKQKLAETDDKKDYWTKKKETYRKDQEKIGNFLKDAQKIVKKDGTESKQNIEDPDSRILKFKRGSFGPGYNAQAASCDETGLIIAASVSSAVSDTENFAPMMEEVQNSIPEEKREVLKDSKFLFDNGYYSTDNIVKAAHEKHDVYVADGQSKDIFSDKKSKTESEKKVIGSKDCELSKTKDGIVLKCPGKKVFTTYSIGKKEDRKLFRFTVEECDTCKNCQYYDICVGKYTKKGKKKEFKIDSEKIKNFEILEDHRNKLHSEDGKMIYSRRMPTIEKVFAFIKGKLGFTSFSRKGMKKVKIEWVLGCIAYNLTRMFNLQCAKYYM